MTSLEYSTIAEKMAELYSMGTFCVQFLDDLQTVEQNIEVPSSKTNAKTSLDHAIVTSQNNIYASHVSSLGVVSTMVIALNRAATLSTPTLDAFLQSVNLKVSPSFASLSGQVGYPISVSNIA